MSCQYLVLMQEFDNLKIHEYIVPLPCRTFLFLSLYLCYGSDIAVLSALNFFTNVPFGVIFKATTFINVRNIAHRFLWYDPDFNIHKLAGFSNEITTFDSNSHDLFCHKVSENL